MLVSVGAVDATVGTGAAKCIAFREDMSTDGGPETAAGADGGICDSGGIECE